VTETHRTIDPGGTIAVIDLTTRLNNYALTCDRQAENARADAERYRGVPRTNFEEYNKSQIDQPVREAEALAAHWTQRAAEARRGFLLLDPADIKFAMDNQDLMNEALAQGRVTYAGVLSQATGLHPADDPSWQATTALPFARDRS
jgi:hypothetical protein